MKRECLKQSIEYLVGKVVNSENNIRLFNYYNRARNQLNADIAN